MGRISNNYRIIPPNRKPKVTAKITAIVPGIKNGWLKTKRPMRVVPVSSICTAATSVGYVGRINRPDTAENDAIAVSGLT